MNDLAEKRRSKQPLEYPSAGSTFKRPEGHFAGKLIQDAGLSGYTTGGACVSEKHCGFVINKDHGTAADILAVCRHVEEEVERRKLVLEYMAENNFRSIEEVGQYMNDYAKDKDAVLEKVLSSHSFSEDYGDEYME